MQTGVRNCDRGLSHFSQENESTMDSHSTKNRWRILFNAVNMKISVVCQILDDAIGIQNGTPRLWNATQRFPRLFQHREIREHCIANSIGRG